LVILSLVQAAVVSGAIGFAAIRHWIGAAPQGVLADIDALGRVVICQACRVSRQRSST
jgi:hypothetical protein